MNALRFAARHWLRHPRQAGMLVLALALGTGATTGMFSAADALLLRPLPWLEPERLVVIHAVNPHRRGHPAYAASWNRQPVSIATLSQLQGSRVFTGVAAWSLSPHVRLLDRDVGRLLVVVSATSNLLPVLGVQVTTGRPFTPAEDNRPSDSVLLGHSAWLEVFGGDPDVVGRRVPAVLARAGGLLRTYEVVGILPPGFTVGGVVPDFLAATGNGAAARWMFGSRDFHVIGRLAPTETMATAAAAANLIIRTTETAEPTTADVVSLHSEERPDSASTVWLLVAGASLLLLVSSANVAGLLLLDARRRRSEFALRSALGEQMRHLVAQAAAEHLLLAGAGALCGLFFAHWSVRVLVANAPPGLSDLEIAGISPTVAGFAVLTAFLVLVVFSFVPVLLTRAPGVHSVVRADSSSTPPSALLSCLVASQATMGLVLVVCAALLAETFFGAASTPLGFDPKGVVVATITTAGTVPTQPPRLSAAGPLSAAGRRRDVAAVLASTKARTERLVRFVGQFPDVSAVAVGWSPFVQRFFERIEVDGHGGKEASTQVDSVTEGFFRALAIPVLEGRSFTSDDAYDSEAVVVSQSFAARYLSGNAVGGRFYRLTGPAGEEVRSLRRVIGVVGDVSHGSPGREADPVYYQSFGGDMGQVHSLIVRTSGSVLTLSQQLRSRLLELEPGLLVTSVVDLRQAVHESLAEERLRSLMASLYAASTLILAAVGLFTLAGRRLAERRRELGVRLALGASGTAVRALVAKDVLRPVSVGLAVGLLLALGATSILRSSVPGVGPLSSGALLSATAVPALVATLAVVVAVRRFKVADTVRTLAGTLD